MEESKIRLTFKKDERLSSRKLIEQTVNEGKNIFLHPFNLKWLPASLVVNFPVQVAIVVSKKMFDKRYKPPQLPYMPDYPKRYSLSGEFIEDGPFPSNAPLPKVK